MNTHPFYLAGEWRASDTDDALSVKNKFDGSEIGRAARASRKDVLEAITKAAAAFEQTKRLPAYKRSELLSAISNAIKTRHEELSQLLAKEAGKPIRTARQEIDRTISTYWIGSEEAKRIHGDVLPMDINPVGENRVGIIRRFPIGPIGAITPFNFPFNLVAHKVSPALATGCPIIVRPASSTPLCALMLAEIVHEAAVALKYPAGAFNVLPCSTDAAEPLITDERIKLLTFTGSPAVGWPLKNKVGRKRVTLELGGNAGVIVHSDADLDFAAARVAVGAFGYAGQSCISVQRVFVQRSVFDAFSHKLMAKVNALVVGDPLDERTDVGPMIDEGSAKEIEGWVQEAVASGAKLLVGGTRKGNLLMPTVLTAVTHDMKVCAQEVFAPLMTLVPYEDFEAAVSEVDDSDFGLQCGIFTRDIKNIWHAYEHIEVGGVIVNDISSYRIDHMPYGGAKQSGFGREGVKFAMEEMTEPKLLVMNMN
jgi:glyceraldehyde-3-phosphate dehydrogenase (NADP+)